VRALARQSLTVVNKETMMSEAPAMRDLLGEAAPNNWGEWGPDDELGSPNYLDAGEVLRGIRHVRAAEDRQGNRCAGEPDRDPRRGSYVDLR
jgi:hypothetical protein